jgi:hypothetical protein
MQHAVATLIFLVSALIGAEDPAAAKPESASEARASAKSTSIENLVVANAVPDGYSVTRQDIKSGDKLLGHKLLLSRDGEVSKVVVTIENRKLVTNVEKTAAVKGYVNGTDKSLREAGLKLVDRKVPDIERFDFKKRLTVDLTYEKPDGGGTRFVQMQIFFAEVAYSVLIISDGKEEHETLTRWARSTRGFSPGRPSTATLESEDS